MRTATEGTNEPALGAVLLLLGDVLQDLPHDRCLAAGEVLAGLAVYRCSSFGRSGGSPRTWPSRIPDSPAPPASNLGNEAAGLNV